VQQSLAQLPSDQIIDLYKNHGIEDTDTAAQALQESLQRENSNLKPDLGAMTNDATTAIVGTLKGLTDFPKQWDNVKGLFSSIGDAGKTAVDALGATNLDELRQHEQDALKNGQIDQTEFNKRSSLIDQAQAIQDRQGLTSMSAGSGLGATAQDIQAQSDQQSHLAALVTQADPTFARNRAQQALQELFTGTKLSSEQLKSWVTNTLGPNSWDPTKYLGHASTLSNFSPSELSTWLQGQRSQSDTINQLSAGAPTPDVTQRVNIASNLLGRGDAPTAGQLSQEGYAPSPQAISDVAGTTTLGATAAVPIPGLSEAMEPLIGAGLNAASLLPRAAGWMGGQAAQKGWSMLTKYAPWEIGAHAITHLPETMHLASNPALWGPALGGAVAGAATAGGLVAGAKLLQAGGEMGADMLQAAARNSYEGRGLAFQLGARTIRSGAEGVAQGLPYAAATSDSPEQFGEQLGTMGMMHSLLRTPETAGQSVLGSTGDALFVPRGDQPNKPVPDINYHVDPRLDQISSAQAKDLTPSQYGTYTRVKQMMAPYADIYLTPQGEMGNVQQRFAHAGAQNMQAPNGFAVPADQTGTGRAAVFVDPAHFDDTFMHESVGHPAYWLLDQADRQSVMDMVKQKNDPTQFANNYFKDTPLAGQVDYNSLPTAADVQNGAPAGPGGYTKDAIDQEMAAEQFGSFFSGKTIDEWSKDPSAMRQMRMQVGNALEKMGLPSGTKESTTTLGVQPSVTSALFMDSWLRDLAQNRVPNQPTPLGGTPPPATGATTGTGAGAPPPPTTPPIRPANVLSVRSVPPVAAPPQLGGPQTAPAPAPQPAPSTPPAPAQQQPAQQQPVAAAPEEAAPAPPTPAAPAETPAPRAELVSTPDQQHAQIRQLIRQGHSPGQAQAIAEGRAPRAEPVQPAPPVVHQPHGPMTNMRGNVGAYGYVGDTTPDHNSLLGIGSFAHTSKAGSLMDGYSAALTKEGAAMRGVRPGQEFMVNGKVYRYDDTAPSSFKLKGVQHYVSPEYVDVYSPHHAPDKGVSEAEIERQAAIAGRRPEGGGQAGEVASSSSGGGGQGGGAAFMPGGGAGGESSSGAPAAPGGGGGAAEMMAPPAAPGMTKTAQATTLAAPSSASVNEPEDTEPENVPISAAASYAYNRGGGGGYAPAAPGGGGMAAFMPGRRMGGIQPEDEEGEEGESTIGVGRPKSFNSSPMLGNLAKNTAAGLQQALLDHTEALSPDDTRVRKQPDNLFKGEHFQQGDPLHEQVLSNVPQQEKNVLGAAQTAIANRQPMHVTYASAPTQGLAQAPPTTKSRQVEYQMSSPQARLLKQSTAQLAGHSFIPTAIGVKMAPKKGEAHQGYIQGVSTNAIANNHYHLNQAMDEAGLQTPYPKMGDKFNNDLEGYVSNLNAGYRGTGDALQPGTEEYPAQHDPSHVPYRLKPNEAHFLNAVVNNTAARAKSATGLRELARAGGTLLTPEGETNPLRHQIDEHQAEKRSWIAAEPRNRDNPIIQKAAQKRWSEDTLEPSIRTFKAGLVNSVHPSDQDIPEGIRPGKEFKDVTESIGRSSPMGRPDVPMSVAFMPGKADRNRKLNQIERDYSEGKHDEPKTRQRLESLGEDPEQYRFVKGHGLISPHEGDPEALTPEEHQQLRDNLRSQWVSGKLKTSDYRARIAELPLPVKAPGSGVKTPLEEEAPEQEFKSADTSINSSKVPAVFSKVDWKPGQRNIDIGGGRFDTASDFLQQKGVENSIYDPYNRSEEHNTEVDKPDHYHTATISNVLNVIKEPYYRQATLMKARDALQPGGKVHVTAYEGNGSGVPAASSKGWQENRRLGSYLDEVKQVFPDAKVKNGMIVGTKPEAPAGGAAFMPAKAAKQAPAAPVEAAAEKLTKPAGASDKAWMKNPANEGERQDYLEKRVAASLERQNDHPSAIPLKVQRKADGGIQHDPALNPVWEKTDYDIANLPFLQSKGKALDQIEGADKHEDTLDEDEHLHLNQTERKRLSALRDQSAVKTMGDRIAKSYGSIKDIPEIAAGKGWYSRMRDKMAAVFGAGEGGKASPDHELFAQLLGATSAKTPVRDNFIQALDAFEQYKSGKFDRHVGLYNEAYQALQDGGYKALNQKMQDQGMIRPGDKVPTTDAGAMAHWIGHHDIIPKKQNGAKYNSNSEQVLKVLAGKWLKEVGAPKTPNFAGNLTGRTLAATIDVWAARHLHRIGNEYNGEKKAWRPQAAAEPGVSDLDFAFSQDAMKHAAKKVGVNPDDLQAILWYAEKHHYDEHGWTGAQGADKGSFDETWDRAFPTQGKAMSSKDLQSYYQAQAEEAKQEAKQKKKAA
jgi:hypothetical protein